MSKTINIDELRAGDIIAFCPIGGSWIGRLIAAMTWPPGPPPFCHMAIVAPYDGELCVYESTYDLGLDPCLHAKTRCVAGVGVRLLEPRIELHLKVREGEAYVLPKKNPAIQGEPGYDQLEQMCRRLLNVPYDFRMAPAARSYLFGWARFLSGRRPGANLCLFCSEFTTLVYQRMGWLRDGWVSWRYKYCPEKYNPKGAARLYQKLGICEKPRRITL